MYLVSTNPISILCASSVAVRPAVGMLEVAGSRSVGMHMQHFCFSWYVPVHTCMYRYIPVCTGTYLYIQVYTSMYLYILVCTKTFWYVPVHTRMSWYIPVCNSTYMYRRSPSLYKTGTSKYVLYTHTYNTVRTLAVGKTVPIAVGKHNVY